ncbi:hypothetical protein Hamer_G005779 [Homarus americanus]|uniref:Uncharacterized protein n=1 Tax=Homarus americanus TaxID=6706 RepID=A0A8J5JQI0_HOMAM|nr:hypothetical protein Hamer_G005779 [Homarus americanus]
MAKGDKEKCFTSSAADYYNTRKRGNHDQICNTNYNTMIDAAVPIYWKSMECGNAVHVAYWFFYGYQDTCSPGAGAHDADWEHIVVKVIDVDTSNEKLDKVMYYQHEGRYTRKQGNYEVYNTNHPIVYVGKNSHGSYHDDGGSGTCCYFEDFRNPGSHNQHQDTWLNLEELRRDNTSPEWMLDTGSVYFDGITSPLNRDETYDLCNLQGCEGAWLQVCNTCGCAKSDIGDEIM